MKIRKPKASDQLGAVSMLSVTIFAIIITVVATSYIKSVISQQRTALDYDNGTRAYFAAETGIQDGARALQVDPVIRESGKQDCKPVGLSPAQSEVKLKSDSYGLGYTCQIIDITPREIKGSLEPGQSSAVIKIEPREANFNRPFQIVFRWSKNNSNSNEEYTKRSTTFKTFPPVSQWRDIHAMLRVSAIAHPKMDFTESGVVQRVVFLNPTPSQDGYPPDLKPTDNVDKQQELLINNALCKDTIDTESGGYSCVRTLKFSEWGLGSSAFYLRLGSVYRSTEFSIEAIEYGSPYANIPLKNTQATIDVTGKAGDTIFRRVRQSLPLDGYVEQRGPGAALVVGEGICKHFGVGANSNQYQPGCDPLAP